MIPSRPVSSFPACYPSNAGVRTGCMWNRASMTRRLQDWLHWVFRRLRQAGRHDEVDQYH